jgi:hypothetical protein
MVKILSCVTFESAGCDVNWCGVGCEAHRVGLAVVGRAADRPPAQVVVKEFAVGGDAGFGGVRAQREVLRTLGRNQ